MTLLVKCTGCGKDVDSKDLLDLRCLDCRVKAAVESELIAMRKLQRKANRYGSRGVSLEQTRAQSLRIYRRAEKKGISAGKNGETYDFKRVYGLLNKIFEEFFEKEPESRIKIAEMGDILGEIGQK